MSKVKGTEKDNVEEAACQNCKTEMISNEPFYWVCLKCPASEKKTVLCHFCMFDDETQKTA